MNTFLSSPEDKFQTVDLFPESQLEAIKNAIKEEDWKRAKEAVSSQMELGRTNVNFLMLAAEVFTQLADYPGALKIFHQVLDVASEKDPVIFEVYKNMGNVYLKCGDIDAAEEKYNLANAINSQDQNLIINYGVLAIQKNRYSEAKARFAEVLQKNEASDLAWVGLGLVHRAHADHDLARACLLRGLDENPYNKLAISNYYQWCLQDGVDATNAYIEDFLAQYPNDVEMNKLANGISQ